MKNKSKEIVIDAFKEGTYPQGQFKSKELAEIASTYDPDVYEAPILIGHVSDYKGKTQIPAFGWIGKAKVVGDHLKLVVSQFSEQLKEFIQQGFYKKVSAAFFQPDDPNNPTPGKWHLHHLAFLGGTPPQVKGLEGIAFAEMTGIGIEFAETDMAVEGIDKVEKVGIEDTVKDLTECCATFISKIEDSLTSDADYDTKKTRCQLAASDLSSEIYNCLNMQWMFQEKLENIEEHKEMSEKKTIVQRLIELAENLTTKRKESVMDDKKEKEYQDEIKTLKDKVTEFTEKERVAEQARITAEQIAKDETLKTEIKTFCEQKSKPNEKGEVFMTPAMREKDEKTMFDLGKVSPEALKSFQEKYTTPIVPLGETEFKEKKEDNDKRPQVIKSAEKYVKAHPKEFSGLSAEDATARAVFRQSRGEIKFEDK